MSVLCAAVLAFSGLAVGAADGGPDRLGYVVVPDLRATLGRMEQVVATVAPGTLPPGMLAVGLGARLGDPGLAGLGSGPLVLVFQRGSVAAGPPSVTAFIPVAHPEPYERALVALGWTVARRPGLVVGSSANVSWREEDYRGLEAETFAGDIRLSLSAQEVLGAYGPVMQAAVDTLTAGLARSAATAPPDRPAPPPPTAVARMLQLEASGFLLLLAQTDQVVSDVSLQPEAIVTETVVTTRPDTALAELAAHPPVGGNGAVALLSRPAVMTAAYQLDAPRLSAFMADLLRGAAADKRTAALATPELQALLDQWGRAFTGEAAMAVHAGALSPLVTESALKVKDEAAALAFLEKGPAVLAPGTPWASLYADLGMPLRLALQKNVRRHGSVAVHRFQMKLDATAAAAASPLQEAQYAMFLRDTELAFARGYLLSAQEPAALDALIDRAAVPPSTAAPLEAVRAFGQGAQVYVDYDVFGLLRAAMSAMPPGQAPNPFAALPAGGSPLLYAAWLGEGRVRLQTKVPLQPFAALFKAMPRPDQKKARVEGLAAPRTAAGR